MHSKTKEHEATVCRLALYRVLIMHSVARLNCFVARLSLFHLQSGRTIARPGPVIEDFLTNRRLLSRAAHGDQTLQEDANMTETMDTNFVTAVIVCDEQI